SNRRKIIYPACLPKREQHSVVHQITEVRLLIGLEVPSKYDLVASRKKNIRQEAVFILPLVPQAAWVSTLKIATQ
ncbi:MAG: hypothetical protein KGZ41_02955, partial [Dethiobacter sp.]|nr:hypothetical protein [Dethiobacter sp.]